jgi:hypothetical protein
MFHSYLRVYWRYPSVRTFIILLILFLYTRRELSNGDQLIVDTVPVHDTQKHADKFPCPKSDRYIIV